MTPGGSSSGWRILSIWSSDFSSILARSAVAASSTARIRSFTLLFATRSVFRSTSTKFTSATCGFVSFVPAGRYSSTVPALSIRPTSWLDSSSAISANIASEMRAFSSASSRRTSPMRSPRTFSTTWSSMREKILTSMTTPSIPGGAFSDESFTSFAFSPKIAVSSFSSGESSVAFRRDLADQDVARLHMGADPHDAPLVEVNQRLLGDVRDLARDLLTAALGVADVQLELLDVDRRIDVVLHEALGEHDRVFEVVAVPRHERHGDVGAEREIPALRARAVSDDLPRLHLLAHVDERPLVDGGDRR